MSEAKPITYSDKSDGFRFAQPILRQRTRTTGFTPGRALKNSRNSAPRIYEREILALLNRKQSLQQTYLRYIGHPVSSRTEPILVDLGKGRQIAVLEETQGL